MSQDERSFERITLEIDRPPVRVQVAGVEDDAGLRVERYGRVELWTLDRPERRNALSRALVRALGIRARAVAKDREVRALVITGAGDKAFSAGADLKERKGMSLEETREFLPFWRSSFGAIDKLPIPVFAAINGAAFGGGFELALACDFRLMAAGAEVGLTETSLGIIPGAGGTQRLTHIVGEARAKELILFAKRIGAERALALGVVSEVVPEGSSVRERAMELAGSFEDAAPIAIAAALEAIDGARDHDLEAGLSLERRCYDRTLESEDRIEALKAFGEKRRPRFEGK